MFEAISVTLNGKTPSNKYLKKGFYSATFLYPGSSSCSASPYRIVFQPGKYRFECFGGKGGGDEGGNGGYSSGIIKFSKEQILFLFVGAQGAKADCETFGGGGIGAIDGYTGGGATDFRIEDSDSSKTLESRIIVAGGGGGQTKWRIIAAGGYGGGIKGGDSSIGIDQDEYGFIKPFPSYGANQTSGGIGTLSYSSTGKPGYEKGTDGTFGKGGSSQRKSMEAGGGGGGYYGGASSNDGYAGVSGGSGGSSFISGLKDCNAVNENGEHTGAPFHYSNLIFKDPITIPNINNGNGFAIISSIQLSIKTSTNNRFLCLNIFAHVLISIKWKNYFYI